MSEVALDNASVTEPIATVIPEVPAPPEEKTYTYQPTDEAGRTLGGVQVIKYHTVDELTQKLTEQNTLLVRKLRETTKKNRLGIQDSEEIPQTAPRFDNPVEFAPRHLTADERVKLSRDLLDPERFDEASDTLFEATVGAKPEALRQTLTNLQVTNLRLLAKAESDAFLQTTPGYYRCQENFETITNWMLKNQLHPIRENFQLAYETLKTAGLLFEAPIVREDVPAALAAPSVIAPVTETEQIPANSQSVQAEPSRITTETPTQETRPVTPRVPTGLTRNQTSDAGAAPKKEPYTLAEINAMPSDIYKRKLLSERGFSELVEKLETEAKEKRNKR